MASGWFSLPVFCVTGCIGLAAYVLRVTVLRQEVEDSVKLLDERRGILHVRRHLAASPLFKGIPNFRDTRIAMLRAETKEELYRIFNEIAKLNIT